MRIFARYVSPALLVALSACSNAPPAPAGTTSEDVTADGTHPCAERARNFSGDKAKNLIQAMIFAGVQPTTTGGDGGQTTSVYALDTLSCEDAHAFEDGIVRYDCNSPDTGDDNAKAKVLFDAVYGLKIASDGGAGHTFAQLTKVDCSVDIGDQGVKYACNVTGLWASDCHE